MDVPRSERRRFEHGVHRLGIPPGSHERAAHPRETVAGVRGWSAAFTVRRRVDEVGPVISLAPRR